MSKVTGRRGGVPRRYCGSESSMVSSFAAIAAPGTCRCAVSSHTVGSIFNQTRGGPVKIEEKIKELGFELPNPPTPAANYIGYVRVGDILYIGGNIGRLNGVIKYRGKVG